MIILGDSASSLGLDLVHLLFPTKKPRTTRIAAPATDPMTGPAIQAWLAGLDGGGGGGGSPVAWFVVSNSPSGVNEDQVAYMMEPPERPLSCYAAADMWTVKGYN